MLQRAGRLDDTAVEREVFALVVRAARVSMPVEEQERGAKQEDFGLVIPRRSSSTVA